MELNDLDPIIPYKIKSPKKFKISFIHHVARMYWAQPNELDVAPH